jgi:hypothetical protein
LMATGFAEYEVGIPRTNGPGGAAKT